MSASSISQHHSDTHNYLPDGNPHATAECGTNPRSVCTTVTYRIGFAYAVGEFPSDRAGVFSEALPSSLSINCNNVVRRGSMPQMKQLNYEKGAQFIRWFFCGFVLAAIAMMSIGCSGNTAALKPQTAAPALVHTVSYRGETLGLISKWYTGQSRNWKIVAEHNPKLEVSALKLGDVVNIPASLVVNRQPLPKNEVRKLAKTRASLKTSAAPVQSAPIKRIPQISEHAAEEVELLPNAIDSEVPKAQGLPDVSNMANALLTKLQSHRKIVTCNGGKCFISVTIAE